MTANELADVMEKYSVAGFMTPLAEEFKLAATMLRQQQAEIEALKAEIVAIEKNTDYWADKSVKELTDEEINVVAILQDAEIVPLGHEIWKTGEEFNKYKRIVLATAKALRKAQEK